MATTMKAQVPTEAPARFEQTERFRVEAVGSKGEIVSQLRTDDPDKAMRTFVTLVDADKLKDRGAGSHIAITDERLKLGGFVMSEGFGSTRFRFEKPEGAAHYEQTRAVMGAERMEAERTVAGAALNERAKVPDSIDPAKSAVVIATPEVKSRQRPPHESGATPLGVPRPSSVVLEDSEMGDGKSRARFTTLRNAAAQTEKSFQSEAKTATRLSAETAIEGRAPNELSVERPSADVKAPTRDADTELLRTSILESHRRDPNHTPSLLDNPAARGVFNEERETIQRMTRVQLGDYQAAREVGPSKSAATMKAAMREVHADLDTGPRRSAIPPLEDRFNIVSRGLVSKDYEFRDQPGKIAFSESLHKLSSQTDNPAAAKAMVDRALERGWETVRISGSSEFTRQAWIAATVHGLKAIGHTPTPGDARATEKDRERLELSRSLRDAPSRQQAEPIKSQGGSVEHVDPAAERVRRSSAVCERQLAAAIDKALRDSKVPANLRDRMCERMAAEGARRAMQGERFNVRVYDPKAPRAKPKTTDVGPQRVADRERAR